MNLVRPAFAGRLLSETHCRVRKFAKILGFLGENSGYLCGYTAFQDRQSDSVSDCSDSDLRKSDSSVAAPIASPNGHNLAAKDSSCHLTADLGRVVQAWQKLSAEARLMIMALVSAAEAG